MPEREEFVQTLGLALARDLGHTLASVSPPVLAPNTERIASVLVDRLEEAGLIFVEREKPPKGGQTIHELYAFVVLDDGRGDEGIPAVSMGGMLMPLMGGDVERMDSLRAAAVQAGHLAGSGLELRRYRQVSAERLDG